LSAVYVGEPGTAMHSFESCIGRLRAIHAAFFTPCSGMLFTLHIDAGGYHPAVPSQVLGFLRFEGWPPHGGL